MNKVEKNKKVASINSDLRYYHKAQDEYRRWHKCGEYPESKKIYELIGRREKLAKEYYNQKYGLGSSRPKNFNKDLDTIEVIDCLCNLYIVREDIVEVFKRGVVEEIECLLELGNSKGDPLSCNPEALNHFFENASTNLVLYYVDMVYSSGSTAKSYFEGYKRPDYDQILKAVMKKTLRNPYEKEEEAFVASGKVSDVEYFLERYPEKYFMKTTIEEIIKRGEKSLIVKMIEKNKRGYTIEQQKRLISRGQKDELKAIAEAHPKSEIASALKIGAL